MLRGHDVECSRLYSAFHIVIISPSGQHQERQQALIVINTGQDFHCMTLALSTSSTEEKDEEEEQEEEEEEEEEEQKGAIMTGSVRLKILNKRQEMILSLNNLN